MKKATSTPTPRPTSQPEVKSDNATNQSEDHEPPTTYITITPITPTPTQVESEPETSGYCEINADKTSGSVPLTVNFTYTYVAIYTKADNWVTGIQWDFDGDGNWDTEMGNEQTNIRPTHNYVAGNYTARMRIQLKSGYTTDVCTKEIKAL
jgi:PKD repeat protein